jgi:hypothetical protein
LATPKFLIAFLVPDLSVVIALERKTFSQVSNKFAAGGFSGRASMDHRDQELLEKQLHSIYVAPRNDGVLILAVLAVFFAGIALGGFLFAYTSQPEPLRIASSAAQIAQR